MRFVSRGLTIALLVGAAVLSEADEPTIHLTCSADSETATLRNRDPGAVFAELHRLADSPDAGTRHNALLAWSFQLSRHGHLLGLKERSAIAEIALSRLSTNDERELYPALMVFAEMGEWKMVEDRCRVLLQHENGQVRALALWVLCQSGKPELGRELITTINKWSSPPSPFGAAQKFLLDAVHSWVVRCPDGATISSTILEILGNKALSEDFRERVFHEFLRHPEDQEFWALLRELSIRPTTTQRIRDLASQILQKRDKPGTP